MKYLKMAKRVAERINVGKMVEDPSKRALVEQEKKTK